MEIIVFSDLHCTQHKKSQARLEDCIKVLEWVFDSAKQRNIKNIVFCGDLFHDRKQIDIMTYQRVFEVFQKQMKDKFNVYLLLGNHDLFFYEKKDISSVYPLSCIDGITIVKDPSTINIDGYDVGFLPYTHDPISDLDKIKLKTKRKVLFGHIAVSGALFNLIYGTMSDVQIEGDNEMTIISPEIFNEYDRVFLGHYHAAQQMTSTVEYVGSPLQLSFGEMEQTKHIVVYNLETDQREYIVNDFSSTHRRYKTAKEALNEATINNLENEFIEVYNEDLLSTEVIELKQLLSKQNLGSLAIKQSQKKSEQEIIQIQDAKSLLTSTDQMLDKYIQSMIDLKLDKNELLKIGKTICDSIFEEDE